MTDVIATIAGMERSLDATLRDLVRFGTQEQADEAHRTRERLRLAQMKQAVAKLEERNEAILALASSLQMLVDELKRHPVGSALDIVRSAAADCELMLDRVQRQEASEAPEVTTPSSPGPEPQGLEQPVPAPARPSSPTAPTATTSPASASPANQGPVERPQPERWGHAGQVEEPTPAAPSASAATAPTGSVPPALGAGAGPPPIDTSAEAPSKHPPGSQPDENSAPLKLPAPNERFRAALLNAADRCGLAPCALAALIDAEAARLPDGGWDPNSANPRSSARGLTQFLGSTWIEMAKRPGTFLNDVCRSRGMVDESNAVVPARQGDVLDLRFDPELSIIAAADFAKQNLGYLRANECVGAAMTDDELARIAYLAHHEGPAGARAFIKGTLSESRAEHLLRINAGARAGSLRDEHGSWRAAYTAFLNGYIGRKIQPARFRP